MQMIKAGYIGLGKMGHPMAANILKAGFPLTVWNRTPEKAQDLIQAGAAWAESAAEVAASVDVIFTNVSDTPDVMEVVFGLHGVAEGAHPGLIFVDHSTIKPSASREIARRLGDLGVACLDAPVSGGDIGAINGTLTIMVGGEESALEQVRPVLAAEGKTITLVGGPGSGQIAKAANQIMVAAQMVAEAELMIFAQAAGADPSRVVAAIRGGAAQCWTLDVKPQRLLAGNRQPGFKASLQAKDLNIVLETARETHVAVPGTAIAAQLFNAMVALGAGELDNSAVIGVIEMLSGQSLDTAQG